MATTDLPNLILQGKGGGSSLWYYTSTVVHTTVDDTDYFTNGTSAGMKVGDQVIVVKSTATIGATLHSVITATAGGAVSLSDAILA